MQRGVGVRCLGGLLPDALSLRGDLSLSFLGRGRLRRRLLNRLAGPLLLGLGGLVVLGSGFMFVSISTPPER